MINLFDYCYNKSALHKNYVQAVAEAWGLNKIKNLDDLENYYMGQEKLMKIKKEIECLRFFQGNAYVYCMHNIQRSKHDRMAEI